jgi:hypothetical protein
MQFAKPWRWSGIPASFPGEEKEDAQAAEVCMDQGLRRSRRLKHSKQA